MADKEYIERGALLKNIDDYHHTSHIQSITRETEKEKTLWWGIHSGVNYCRNTVIDAPAADVVSRGVFEQVKWERDIAMEQLKDHKIPFGCIAPDVVEVKHGYWIPYSSTMMECSVCKRHTARHRYEFCPRCGAKMDRK